MDFHSQRTLSAIFICPRDTDVELRMFLRKCETATCSRDKLQLVCQLVAFVPAVKLFIVGVVSDHIVHLIRVVEPDGRFAYFVLIQIERVVDDGIFIFHVLNRVQDTADDEGVAHAPLL